MTVPKQPKACVSIRCFISRFVAPPQCARERNVQPISTSSFSADSVEKRDEPITAPEAAWRAVSIPPEASPSAKNSRNTCSCQRSDDGWTSHTNGSAATANSSAQSMGVVGLKMSVDPSTWVGDRTRPLLRVVLGQGRRSLLGPVALGRLLRRLSDVADELIDVVGDAEQIEIDGVDLALGEGAGAKPVQ